MAKTVRELMQEFKAPECARFVKQFKNGNIQIEVKGYCPRCMNDKGIFYVRVHNGQPVPSSLDNGVSKFIKEPDLVITKEQYERMIIE